MYQKTLDYIKTHFSKNKITQSDTPSILAYFSKEKTIELISSIVADHELLTKIAKRSYTHALGFDKLVLVDLSKDVDPTLPKTQLRLHIWNPENDSVPMVESLHEHSFDFVSVILSGYLENQCFTMEKLNEDQANALNDLKNWIKTTDQANVRRLDQCIEILESKRLSLLGSQQFNTLYTEQELLDAVHFIMKKTPFKDLKYFLSNIVNLQGHYVSDRIAGERKAYKHVLNDHVSLKPYDCPTTHAGHAYFHPYELPHRLFYDNKNLNATILVTTPVPENPKGGSLQRPTYVQENEQNYDKKPISIDELKQKLDHIKALLTNKE